jgi:hypothetical protein
MAESDKIPQIDPAAIEILIKKYDERSQTSAEVGPIVKIRFQADESLSYYHPAPAVKPFILSPLTLTSAALNSR